MTGAKGMLAQAFLKKIPEPWHLLAVDIDKLDICDPIAIHKVMEAFRPELIINCAAFTQVDACEEKKELAFSVNGAGAGNLAEAANRIGAYLVHFSTDYIFDGTGKIPYKEDDPARPINVYGASKWEGECQIRKHLKRHLIVRTQWLYGEGGNHFVRTMMRLAETQSVLKIVDDQVGAPTCTEDLAKASLELIDLEALGTCHLVNSGQCTWYGFASRIFEEAGLSVKLQPCTTAAFPRPAKRPGYSVLGMEKAIGILGHPIPHWQTALKHFMHPA